MEIVPKSYAKACRADLLPFERGWATELRNRKSSIFPVRVWIVAQTFV